MQCHLNARQLERSDIFLVWSAMTPCLDCLGDGRGGGGRLGRQTVRTGLGLRCKHCILYTVYTVYCTYSGVTEYAFGGKYEHCILHLAVTEYAFSGLCDNFTLYLNVTEHL